jgi:hypothetical protein
MDNSPAAADVLVEARRNLQSLIDSGIPRHILHQLVEESQGNKPPYDDQSATCMSRVHATSTRPQIPWMCFP